MDDTNDIQLQTRIALINAAIDSLAIQCDEWTLQDINAWLVKESQKAQVCAMRERECRQHESPFAALRWLKMRHAYHRNFLIVNAGIKEIEGHAARELAYEAEGLHLAVEVSDPKSFYHLDFYGTGDEAKGKPTYPRLMRSDRIGVPGNNLRSALISFASGWEQKQPMTQRYDVFIMEWSGTPSGRHHSHSPYPLYSMDDAKRWAQMNIGLETTTQEA